ncbi:MAG: serine/threonine-protein kinase [Ramlibacter sp.]
MSLKKLGRYDLVRVLGKGAMGIVYEGRDPNLDRRVAIKTVKVENLSEEAAAEYEARFRTEARSAARLQHPNIVSVYDSDRDGDIAFLVMEFIQGDDLKHHLDRGERYSLEQVLKIIRDLLSALDYAHKQGIVHRDIKPANLLIEPGGRVKLTDFGVARIQDSGEATRTQGSMVGTLKYMSPEQVQGQKIDSRADLFSVGVVLYQLLTDRRPFDGDNDFSIIHQIIGHTPQPPSAYNARLPAALDGVVARALAKDREQRFSTARDFATALQSAIRRAEDATVVPPADPMRKPVEDGPGTGSRGTAAGTGTSGTSGTSATSATSATVTQELELVYWKDIKDSTDPEELEMFLAKFPAGIYGDLARRRLRKLQGGSSPDQTVLSGVPGAGTAGADLDQDATRLRTDLSQPMLAPDAPAPVVAPIPPATVPPPVPPPVAAVAPVPPSADEASPASGGEPLAAAPVGVAPVSGRSPGKAVYAGIGAVVAVGIAAYFFTAGGKPPAGASGPASTASAPVSAEPAAVAAVPASAVATPAVAAAASAASRPASAAVAAAAKRAASQPRVLKPASAPGATATVETTPAAPVEVARASQPRAAAAPATAPVAEAGSPNDACKDRMFLAKEFCLKEQCDSARFQNHPVCVKRREEAKMREDSKVRN